MKSIRMVMAVLWIAFMFFGVWTTKANSQVHDANALEFSISLDTNSYLVNQSITLTMVLQNISENRLYAPSLDPLDNQLTIYVVSAREDTLQSSYISGSTPGWEYPTLDSMERDINFINLLGPIYSVGIITEEAIFSRLIPVGEYTVQAKLWHRIEGLDESIFSNRLSFRVENPSGKAGELNKLLINAWWTKCIKNKDYRGGASDFLKIINEYPSSPYIDGAYSVLAYLLRVELKDGYKGETFESIAKRYLHDYPNSGMVVRFIKGLRPGPGKTAERKKFYDDIIKKHPDTKASTYAESQLDKWRRGRIWVDEPMPRD
jgi:hypothetical protein